MKTEEIWTGWSESIARTIRAYMKNEKLDRAGAAAKLGVTPQYMSRILSGKENLSLKNIAGIGEGLGIPDIIKCSSNNSYKIPKNESYFYAAESPIEYIAGEKFESKEETPSFVYRTEMTSEKNYVEWLTDLKQRFNLSQTKAAITVNKELLEFYWGLGRDLVTNKIEERYGKNIIKNLSKDLGDIFPGQRGFSVDNLYLIKRWYLFYYQAVKKFDQAGQKLIMPAKFAFVPWRHHVEIVKKTKSVEEAVFYINKTIEGGWSRSMLESQLKSDLFKRQGAAITNFSNLLPTPNNTLAQQVFKDPYNFEFLTLKSNYDEKNLEDALVSNITNFLLELGQGFAFIGRQLELRMPDGNSYYPDLVFYHTKLKSYVVVELKAVEFKPEFAGKINFYISAADELLKSEGDNQSIGLIICKSSNKTIVEWSLRGIERPLGVASYQIEEVVERTVKELEAQKK